jgi:hypothetical protein
MAFTYDELKQAIQDYTENAETTFVNNLPIFIRATEERILKNVQLNLFMRNLQGIMTTGNHYLGAPSDFLAPFSLTITVGGKKEFLEFKDLSFVETFNPDVTVTGQPRYYGQFDVGNFILAPTPDQDYAVELQYLSRPASLTAGSGTGTSWLSENAELAMLYGALVEAYIFMKGEPDIMALYNQRFNEAVVGLKMLGEAKETTQEYRVGKVVRPKQ